MGVRFASGQRSGVVRASQGRRPAGTGLTWIGMAIVALVVCGSLAPFRFDMGEVRTVSLLNVKQLAWLRPGAEDVIVNLLVYLPIGFFVSWWMRRRLRITTIIAISGVVGGLLSVAVEATQTLIPGRCASWVDVVLNLSGAMIGAALAPVVVTVVRWGLARLRAAFARSPLATFGLLLTVGLMVQGAAPFDFVTSADGFRRSLYASQWPPFVERRTPAQSEPAFASTLGVRGPTTAEGPANDYAPLVSTVGIAGVFAVLGGVMALAYRRSPRFSASPLAAAVQHGVIVALLIETIQLFLASRTFDTSDILVNGVAAGIGAWSALAVLDRTQPATAGTNSGPALLVAALAVGQIAYAVIGASVPFDLSRSHIGSAQVCWAPLSGYVRMPFLTAVGHLTSGMLAYALLAASVALYSWLRWGRARWVVVAVVVGCTSVACELVQLYSQVRVTDLTQPVMALIAVMACQALACRLAPPRAALVRQHG